MAQITPEQRAPRIAQVPTGLQRRYEASPAEATPDVSGYIEGVTAIIAPPRQLQIVDLRQR
jgi:hypothetical protein